MKQQAFSLILLIFVSFCVHAQKTKLPDSKRWSEKAYIYKISPENLKLLYAKGKLFSETMLGEKVAEYPNRTAYPKQPRGNYLI